MQYLVNIVLAACLALSGLPHAFCACGCGGDAAKAKAKHRAPACRHCHRGQPDRGPEAPTPCECPHCEQVKATVPAPAVNAPSLTPGSWLDLPSVAAVASCVPAAPVELGRGVGPPEMDDGPPVSIPILLGHLLL